MIFYVCVIFVCIDGESDKLVAVGIKFFLLSGFIYTR